MARSRRNLAQANPFGGRPVAMVLINNERSRQRHFPCLALALASHCSPVTAALSAQRTRSYVAFFPTKRQIPPGARGPVNTGQAHQQQLWAGSAAQVAVDAIA